MGNARFSRQTLAFGNEGQRRLSNLKVGIVGLGGIGSLITQNLVHLGVRRFLLIDDDIVEETNLNRLVGAVPEDAKEKKLKLDVAERLITAINPHAETKKYPSNLRTESVLDALTDVDYIFGCVDNDGARLILTELSSAFQIPLIDSAFEIQVENESVTWFGGRVIIALPGEFCVICANQLDLDVAKMELESPPLREYRENHGYGLGQEVTAPSVISLNAIISGIAVTEFLMLVTKIREPNKMVIYKGERGIVTVRADGKKSDCLICNTIVGTRELTNIKRYSKTDLPKDLPI